MTLYKVIIDNRSYTTWAILNATTLEPILLDINPLEHKLLHNDVFTYNKGNVEIISSPIRNNLNISAVLILAENKTYGREMTALKIQKHKEGRLLYKCVPDDIRLPIFLVPYEIKQLGFSKVVTNQYVTIDFKEWTNKHPYANINQIIGSVDNLEHFYEYQLYCKSLNTSIQKLNKATMKAIKNKISDNTHDNFISDICKQYHQIENRCDWKVFTIDPPTSLDFDDGFSIKVLDNGDKLLSIYIANVTIWLDALSLWPSFSQRVSTIYLPDKKRPMLPTILSDCLCSLQQNMSRFALVMDIIVDSENNIVNINYSNCLIKVVKNYAYEESALLENSEYNTLFTIANNLSKKYKYISKIKDSHDLVAYLMILMNYKCAKNMLSFNNGIFRSAIIKKDVPIVGDLPVNLPEDVNKFIKIWNSTSGQYIDISSLSPELLKSSLKHDLLEVDAYIHITSPIRRLVDLLNMIQLQQNYNLFSLSKDALEFYSNWLKQIEYINTTMRLIRKVQNDCTLLDTCCNCSEMLDKTFDGYCFDKLERHDKLYNFTVYLPELKMVSRIIVGDNLSNYEKKQFKLYIFHNEEKFKRKIRLQLVGDVLSR